VAKQTILKGDTSRIEYIFIPDSTVTTGAGKTGLVFNSAGLVAYYVRTQAAAVAITLATQTVTGAFSSGGFVEVDATNLPGIYRFDPPDACFASGVDKVVIMLKGATGMAPVPMEYQLSGYDPEALTWLTPATAGRTLVVDAAGLADANAVKVGPTGAGTAQTARDIGASVLLSSGVGTGQVKLAAGYVAPNWGDVGNPTTAVNLSGTNIDVDQVVASVSGAVGSVTGAVGSVTGAVGSVTAGVTLAASAVQAIWDALTTALTTVGSIGKRLADFVTGDAFVRLGAPAGASVSVDIAAVKTQTAAIEVDTGTDIPASLTIIDDFLDTEVAAIKAKTDTLPGSPAAVGSAMTLTSGERDAIADALLDRNMATGTDSGSPTVRTMRQALRFLRNYWDIVAGVLTVRKEDDVTASWTSTLTTTAAAEPVTKSDPAGP